MVMDVLDEWGADFVAFHSRFADVFGRKEPRAQAVKYLRGLMAQIPRKTSWQVAETVGDRIPDATQRLLYRAHWEADEARDVLQEYIIEVFGDEAGIGVVDETGFIKKGKRSVGVQRQYSGMAGKIENCQIGTFLSYVTSKGNVFLDRRLYLPEEWCNDAGTVCTGQGAQGRGLSDQAPTGHGDAGIRLAARRADALGDRRRSVWGCDRAAGHDRPTWAAVCVGGARAHTSLDRTAAGGRTRASAAWATAHEGPLGERRAASDSRSGCGRRLVGRSSAGNG